MARISVNLLYCFLQKRLKYFHGPIQGSLGLICQHSREIFRDPYVLKEILFVDDFFTLQDEFCKLLDGFTGDTDDCMFGKSALQLFLRPFN